MLTMLLTAFRKSLLRRCVAGGLFSLLLAGMLGVFSSASVALASSEQGTPGELPLILISARDAAPGYKFVYPSSIPAGLVHIRLENRSHDVHHVQLLHLNHGVTFDYFKRELLRDEYADFRLSTIAGGAGTVAPQKSQDVVVRLTSGNYALVCYVVDENGQAHYKMGMLQPLTVIPQPPGQHQTEPRANYEATLSDFDFRLPSAWHPGSVVVKVNNQGQQAHEMNLFKLNAGKNVKDVLNYLHKPQGTPPYTPVGGANAIAPNTTMWAMLNLERGNYVALCSVPDPKKKMPHYDLGMIKEFKVQ
jgi:uncharacterized cupredoxin-like copper-binding protein